MAELKVGKWRTLTPTEINFTHLSYEKERMDDFECGAPGGHVGRQADGQLEPATASLPRKNRRRKSPPKKSKAKAEAKPAAPAAPPSSIILSPGAAAIVGKNVNVRGKASFTGEVITKLQNGEPVTVIEQVILSKPKAGEPVPMGEDRVPCHRAHVWVHSSYLNADKTVKPKKLNIRTGAGENYSVVGTLEQGTTVKEVSTKGNWTEIQAPADAYAFVGNLRSSRRLSRHGAAGGFHPNAGCDPDHGQQ